MTDNDLNLPGRHRETKGSMADDQDPLDDAPEPETDTPDDEAEDTAEAADSSQSDWTPKDRSEATRKITELAQENARLRREAAAAAEAPAEAGGDDGGSYLEDQNALLAGELYGEEVIEAAEAVWPLLEVASTTADYMALFEAYHAARSKGASPAEAASGTPRTRQEAVQPRVDTNRSDGSPDSDDRLAEAKKSGNLAEFSKAAAAILMGERVKR
jgi:hypothetical protein